MCVIVFLLTFVLLGQFIEQSVCQLPPNPCPNIFQYLQKNGNYLGEVRIPYDGSDRLNIAVNISMSGIYDAAKLKIELLTPTNSIKKSDTLTYRLHFPFQDVIPKITQIRYNNKNFCNGPPENLSPNGVTNLWSALQHNIQKYVYTINGVIENPLESIGQGTGKDPNYNLFTLPPNQFLLEENKPSTPFNSQFFTLPGVQNSAPTPSSKPASEVIPSRFAGEESCGISNDVQHLIVDGEKTTDDAFPWLVAMFYRRDISYDYKCTGNLITNTHVITAAHCVAFYKTLIQPIEDILLVLGRSNLSGWVTTGAIIRTASKIIPHPNFRQFTGHCDAAIIKMNEPVNFKPTLRPICLWNTNSRIKDIVNHEGVVAGWGKTAKADFVEQPFKVRLPVVSQDTCLRSNTKFNNLTSTETFCAGKRDGSGPCNGDSGAGFMMKKTGRWYLRGLVSTSVRTSEFSCDLSEYIVFADVARLRDWILNTIKL